jgi:hypothetical protein
MKRRTYIFLTFFVLISITLFSQQVADTTFNPLIPQPEYASGKGPVVAVDEGHYNFHTAGGRYLPFARLLRADGYVVKEYPGNSRRLHLRMSGYL